MQSYEGETYSSSKSPSAKDANDDDDNGGDNNDDGDNSDAAAARGCKGCEHSQDYYGDSSGVFHGEGVLTFCQGHTYTGSSRNGRLDGKVT